MAKWTEAQKRYSKSARGIEARKKYQQSEKGRATHAAYLAKRKAKIAELKQTQVAEPVKKEEESVKIKAEVVKK